MDHESPDNGVWPVVVDDPHGTIGSDFTEIQESMNQIEASLDQSPSIGRSGWSSLGSALQSLRQRVTRMMAPHDTSANHVPSNDSLTGELSERLRLAELAHSTRTPLGRLQSELQRRREASSTAKASSTTEAAAVAVPFNPKKRRRRSSLVASRSRSTSSECKSEGTSCANMDAEANHDGELEDDESIHKKLSTIRVMSDVEEVSMDDASSEAGTTTTAEFDSTVAIQGSQEDDTSLPYNRRRNTKTNEHAKMEVDIVFEEDYNSPETQILLSEDSSQKLDIAHRSILFGSSESSVSADLDQGPTTEQLLPQVYSWGVTIHSLYDTEESGDPDDLEPIGPSSRVGRTHVVVAATGTNHTAVVTNSGNILTCGKNEYGAVDPGRPLSDVICKPSLLESVTVPVLQVSCGKNHTAAVTTTGGVLSWGNNESYQLGHRLPQTSLQKTHLPQTMALGRRRAAAVACGDGFTLVLTSRMQVLACGIECIAGFRKNKQGDRHLPALLPELFGLPITKIAAGDRHAVAVTCHGTPFAWGDNSLGQCGQEYPKELHVPVPMRMAEQALMKRSARNTPLPPPDVAVADAACGGSHTILTTRSGKLLVCGSNDHGQLGYPPEESAVGLNLKMIMHPETDGKFISAVAGRSHSLALDEQHDVWFLGIRNKGTPKGNIPISCVLKDRSIIGVAAGGDHSIAISALPVEAIPPPLPSPVHRKFSQLLADASAADSGRDVGVTDNARLIQHSVEDLVSAVGQQQIKQQQPATIALSEKAVRELADRAEELLQSPCVLNGLFLDPRDLDHLYRKVLGADTDRAARQVIANSIERGMYQGLQSLETESGHASLRFPESVRFLLLYLQCPLFSDLYDENVAFDRRGDLILLLCESFLGLSYEGYKAMVAWITALYPREVFVKCLVRPLLKQLERGLDENAGPLQRIVPLVVAVLQWLYVTSERAGGIAKAEDFWSRAIISDPERAFTDLRRWKMSNKKQRSSNFFLCSHAFLFSPANKRRLLSIENQMEMVATATRDGVRYNHAEQTYEIDPFWVLEVERGSLLKQTLQKVSQAKPTELRRKLKVVFKGEEGVDAGGVTREFFQLLSSQLFDINSGMWSDKFDEEHVTWFNSDCFWNDEGYYLVGILVGLAVYNSVLLDVRFPPAVYRKLLGLPLGLEDLVDSRLQRSLQQLLEYEDRDVEDVFCLTFSVDWFDLGTKRTVELKPGGSDLAVTFENKEEYVRLYVKWLLEESIHPQYDGFERGFMKVMEHSTLDFMSPEELRLLVVGSTDLDFSALENNTTYEGYEKDSPVVQHLWSFIKSSPEETKIQFLKFSTGASTAPIGGLGHLPFKVQKNGGDSMKLPTSHTCFNTLLLPDYGDNYDKLAERLGRAIQEFEGFGLI